METIQIDWLVVILAAVLNLVIGFIWYSKLLFGSTWAKLSQLSAKELKGNGKTLIMAFVASFVTAYFLAFFVAFLGITTVTDGMFVGFLVWLGFVATTQVSSVIWEKKPFALFLINTGYKLLSFLVMGGLLGA